MLVSCWDVSSLKSASKLKFKYCSIASAMIANLPLLEEVSNVEKAFYFICESCTLKMWILL